MFFDIRGYLSTYRKQGVSATQSMALVFEEKLSKFTLVSSSAGQEIKTIDNNE
jgi:hypothetical protein